MKIAILGYSGSGKSTLARELGKRYGLTVLHLDTVQFEPGWSVRDRDESKQLVRTFLEEHPDGWVIDGNYSAFLQEERLEQADRIVLMLLPRLTCYFRARRRSKRFCGKVRPDMADGCTEKFDWEFRLWILWKGRTAKRSAAFRRIAQQYPDKTVILRSQRAIDRYLQSL